MTSPAIITVAITGSVPQKKDNPAVPVSVAEQIESTYAAFEAGATVVHAHVRNDDGSTSSDPEKFARLLEGVRQHCPGMIVQFSTSGRSGKGTERGGMLRYRPDMASLSTGSVNFAVIVYENPPALVDELAAKMIEFDVKPEIEVFDLAMLYAAHRMAKDGRLKRPLHVQFVFGIANALPPLREILEFEAAQLAKLEPDATWAAAGIGKSQLEVNRWCLEMGGHCRTGLEDNVRYDQTRLAAGNAELVARLADLCGQYSRHAASVAEARRILGLLADRKG
ncbi:MAG: 3-keto-5-aminohexanoate cleavage protein [Hyphomicrobiales bacterium]